MASACASTRTGVTDTSLRWLRVPIAPGQYGDVHVAGAERVRAGERFGLDTTGGGVLSIDGERDVLVAPDTVVEVTVNGDGPFVVDVDAALTVLLADATRSAAPAGSANSPCVGQLAAIDK